MKVLHVLPLLSVRAGGPQVAATEAANSLSPLGVSSTLLATDLARVGYGRAAGRLVSEEIPRVASRIDYRLFPARRPRRLAYSPELRAAARGLTGSHDVVHIHSLWLHPQFSAYREAIRAGKPYIVSPHGALDPYLQQRGRARKAVTSALWQRAMLENAAAIHVTTEEEGRLISDIAPNVPRQVVPLGLTTRDFAGAEGGDRFRDRFLTGHRGPLVVFLGRITEKKGLDTLIRALAIVVGEFPDCHLAVVGPNDEGLQPRLLQLAAAEGLAHRVHFTGPLYRDDQMAALAAADVWALSSYTENFGIAVMEALAAGIPTVVSDAVNLAAEIDRRAAGMVAPPNPRAFAAALQDVLGDPERAARLRLNGQELAADYDWRFVAPRWKRMYEVAGGKLSAGVASLPR